MRLVRGESMKNFKNVLYYIAIIMIVIVSIVFAYGRCFESALLSLIIGIMLFDRVEKWN